MQCFMQLKTNIAAEYYSANSFLASYFLTFLKQNIIRNSEAAASKVLKVYISRGLLKP